MIPMSCPNCGRRGTVPPDRLNTRMHCKKCDAVFYMDASGKIMLGEPGGRAKQPKKKATAPGEKEAAPDYIGMLAGNKAVRMGLVVVAVGAVGYFMIQGVMGFIGKGVPNTVASVNEVIAEAWVDEDLGRIQSYSTPETREDAAKWLQATRKKFGKYGKQVPGNDVQVINSMAAGETEEQANSSGSAHMIATLVAPPDKEPEVPAERDEPAKKDTPKKKDGVTVDYGSKNAAGLYALDVFLTKKDGTWLLDGKKCLDSIPAPASKNPAPTPKKK